MSLSRACDGFSGAEIEQAIISGLFDAFSNGTELTPEIMLASITDTVPLSKTMSEELQRMRTWVQGRARPASGIADPMARPRSRKIEIE